MGRHTVLWLRFAAVALASIQGSGPSRHCHPIDVGFLKVMVPAGILPGDQRAAAPLPWNKRWLWAGEAMLGCCPGLGDLEVQELIRNGNVAYELCRPVDLYRPAAICSGLGNQSSSHYLAVVVPVFALALYVLPESYAEDAIGGWTSCMAAGHGWGTPFRVCHDQSDEYLHVLDYFRRRELTV